MTPKNFVSSKIFLFALIVCLSFLASVKYRQWKVQASIEREKQILIQQADAQQKKRDELSQSLSYLHSSSFKERVARQQLGLKKDGEVVFNFMESQNSSTIESGKKTEEASSNFQKWWKYFVNHY